ncbi:MAG: hypothetical protein HEQ40_13830 [Lacibacter sp.]|jgi:hypothetical protein
MQKDELKRQDGITDDNEQKAEVTGESQHSIKPDVVCSQGINELLEKAQKQKDCVTNSDTDKRRSFFKFTLKEFWFFDYQPLQVPVSVFQKIRYELEDTGEWVNCYYFFNLCLFKKGLIKR